MLVACREAAPPAPPGPVAVAVLEAGAPPPVADAPEEGEVYTGPVTVPRGDTTIVDGRAIFRDAKEQLRARSVVPRETRGTEQRPIKLALGERVIYGAWDVRWSGVREGLVQLEGRRRGKSTGFWTTSTDERIATHDLATSSQLFTFQVRLVATSGRLDHEGGSIEITGRESDLTRAAKYGESVTEGVYVLPDGFRVHFGRGDGCDFDPSEPCPFGTWYRASAAFGDQEGDTELRKRQVKLLGRTLEIVARGTFTVRK